MREDKVIHPGGREGIFGVVELLPGVIIVAITDDGRVCMNREYKYALRNESLELPAGGIEAGQTALDAAKRELHEEAGWTAHSWTSLGQIEQLTTVVSAPIEIFLARQLTEVNTAHEDSEVITNELVPFDEAYQMAMDGRVVFAPAIAALARAKAYLDAEKA